MSGGCGSVASNQTAVRSIVRPCFSAFFPRLLLLSFPVFRFRTNLTSRKRRNDGPRTSSYFGSSQQIASYIAIFLRFLKPNFDFKLNGNSWLVWIILSQRKWVVTTSVLSVAVVFFTSPFLPLLQCVKRREGGREAVRKQLSPTTTVTPWSPGPGLRSLFYIKIAGKSLLSRALVLSDNINKTSPEICQILVFDPLFPLRKSVVTSRRSPPPLLHNNTAHLINAKTPL